MAMTLHRACLIEALQHACEESSHVRAAWLGGSDASSRTDEFSDVDLHVLVSDGTAESTFELIEDAIGRLSPIASSYRLPDPTWHGHRQAFYRFAESSPFLLLDLVVMEVSHPDRFLERERHGDPRVLFDPDHVIRPTPIDHDAMADRRAARLRVLRDQHDLFGVLVTKAVHRGHLAEAVHFYHAFSLRPMIEVLRMVHCPDRFDFGARYLDRDLPADDAAAVARLSLPGDAESLLAMHEETRARFTAASDILRSTEG